MAWSGEHNQHAAPRRAGKDPGNMMVARRGSGLRSLSPTFMSGELVLRRAMKAKEVANAIRSMEIRGAAEIARRSASALKEEALAYSGKDLMELRRSMAASKRALLDSRHSAVSLWNGFQSVFKKTSEIDDLEGYRSVLVRNADEFVSVSYTHLTLPTN